MWPASASALQGRRAGERSACRGGRGRGAVSRAQRSRPDLPPVPMVPSASAPPLPLRNPRGRPAVPASLRPSRSGPCWTGASSCVYHDAVDRVSGRGRPCGAGMPGVPVAVLGGGRGSSGAARLQGACLPSSGGASAHDSGSPCAEKQRAGRGGPLAQSLTARGRGKGRSGPGSPLRRLLRPKRRERAKRLAGLTGAESWPGQPCGPAFAPGGSSSPRHGPRGAVPPLCRVSRGVGRG